MSEDKKYYWLKLKRDFFKRHDIKIIESMENGEKYLLFYLKLLVESLDHSGNLRFSDTVPYNDKMLSAITGTDIDIVRTAVKVFSELGMMDKQDDGTLFMAQVLAMTGDETEWAKKKREQRKGQKEDIVRTLSDKRLEYRDKSIENTIQDPATPCASAPVESLPAIVKETDPLYNSLIDSFLALAPNHRFTNYGKEGKNCKALCKAIRNLSPKAPEDAAKAILERFAAKRSGSDKFWKGQPFTPSGLLPLVDRIVADLQADQGKEIDREVLEGVRF
jgi:predicted phage replisome organizer